MSNRTQLRERLRLELGDTGSVQVWSDDLLDALLVESVGWYSRLWPRQEAIYRDVAEGERTFGILTGTLGITSVECPPGRVLPHEATGPVGAPQSSGFRQSWSLWGETLYLGRGARGDEVGALKLVMQVLLPWPRLDPFEQWPGPVGDERLLVLWSAVEAWAWLDGQDQKRGRPARSGVMVGRYTEELEREVAARRRAATSRMMSSE
ncbi:MAG TPA: hypothetical protein VEY08_16840 [Chloroflexia bacterium]|nr:hypothetical protein [Chloroflexia bacterium]